MLVKQAARILCIEDFFGSGGSYFLLAERGVVCFEVWVEEGVLSALRAGYAEHSSVMVFKPTVRKYKLSILTHAPTLPYPSTNPR